MGLPSRWCLQQCALDLGFVNVCGKDRDDRAGHFVLNCEHILQLAVVTFSPTMRSCRRINQLSSDPHTVTGAPDAALQDVAHAQLAPDLSYVRGLPFVLKAGVASDNEQF